MKWIKVDRAGAHRGRSGGSGRRRARPAVPAV